MSTANYSNFDNVIGTYDLGLTVKKAGILDVRLVGLKTTRPTDFKKNIERLSHTRSRRPVKVPFIDLIDTVVNNPEQFTLDDLIAILAFIQFKLNPIKTLHEWHDSIKEKFEQIPKILFQKICVKGKICERIKKIENFSEGDSSKLIQEILKTGSIAVFILPQLNEFLHQAIPELHQFLPDQLKYIIIAFYGSKITLKKLCRCNKEKKKKTKKKNQIA
jgi:hypothetical protein